MERKVFFQSLVGSHNYNMNTMSSDEDYKYFVLPTFEDLYHGNMYSKSVVTETEDYSVHDIRKLVHLLWKANVNFLEVLYTKKLIVNPEYAHDASFLFDNREEIVTANLPYLFDACVGMHYEKMKLLEKGTSGTIHLVEIHGYDTKQACHAYRILDVLQRYVNSLDFQRAIFYETNEDSRELLLEIKAGGFVKEDFLALMKIKLEAVFKLKDWYHEQGSKTEVRDKLESYLMDVIKRHIAKEIRYNDGEVHSTGWT